MVSRRVFLTGMLAGTAGPVLGSAPETSLIPVPRPADAARRAAPALASVIAEASLGGRVGCSVADARTGEILEHHDGLVGMPPASVAKAITCAYGLDRLGLDHRFITRVVAGGPINNGRLEGDLWLVGGGDPMLNSDDLHGLARQLVDAGLREVTGELRLAIGAFPHVRRIDPDQPDHVGYNPGVGALNLNFNRVYFEWTRGASGYTVSMDARTENLRPVVHRLQMAIEDRGAPVYTYREAQGREEWTVALSALGNGGSRWLPVRNPALYAAEVFQTLARSRGIVLDGPQVGGAPPAGAQIIAAHVSPPMTDILRSMMRYSTNITAECIGLAASAADGSVPRNLTGSGSEMARWMRNLGARNPRFVDHSGLGEESQLRAQDMVAALVATGADGLVRSLMRPVRMLDENGAPVPNHPIEAVGKTGTLNFVSTLAGFARAPTGRDLAFAIFCADLPRRNALDDPQMERPDGGRSYNRRAKRLQQALIERWGEIFA